MNKETVILDTFDGHLVLLCKGHYSGDTDFFMAACRLWAVRAGVPQPKENGHYYNKFLEALADRLYDILKRCTPDRMEYYHQVLHREISDDWRRPENLTPIQLLIWNYRLAVMQLQINETDKETGEYRNLIQLPTAQYGLLTGICQYGWGEYGDYDKLVKKDEKIRSLIY